MCIPCPIFNSHWVGASHEPHISVDKANKQSTGKHKQAALRVDGMCLLVIIISEKKIQRFFRLLSRLVIDQKEYNTVSRSLFPAEPLQLFDSLSFLLPFSCFRSSSLLLIIKILLRILSHLFQCGFPLLWNSSTFDGTTSRHRLNLCSGPVLMLNK